jgi:hypothetical protein
MVGALPVSVAFCAFLVSSEEDALVYIGIKDLLRWFSLEMVFELLIYNIFGKDAKKKDFLAR